MTSDITDYTITGGFMKQVDFETLKKIYGDDASAAADRYASVASHFQSEYGEGEVTYFTAPGRTEIVGNHTDHNGGKVIAASITLDTIGAARATDRDEINVISEGYSPIRIYLDRIGEVPKESGTLSLIAGMVEGARNMGYKVGGFDAYCSTNVIAAAGVSSSASFEMLICAIINHFYNNDSIPYSDYARIGQYSENHFWNKASGLMDQMACAVGGAIQLDFAGDIKYEQIEFDLTGMGYGMVITNTGKGHADLSDDYSAIPSEMRAVAAAFGKERLCEITIDEFNDKLPELMDSIGNDRALMRAFHFLTENQRVIDMAQALSDRDMSRIKAILTESGNSSWKYLQNCYTTADLKTQRISLALAVSEQYIKKLGDGCCRVHGGGFAGVIQCILPKDKVDEYVELMSRHFGSENVYPMSIRATGAVTVA